MFTRIGSGRRSAASAVFVLAVGAVSPAPGQTAYFSLQGNFPAAGDRHDFNLPLSRPVSNAETLRFQTFARNGGTNAAGDSISSNPSGIDSVVTLFNSVNQVRGTDDDQFGGIRDSLLTWTGSDTNLNPSPLPIDTYRLSMIEFNNDAAGPWALDLVGPADAMTLAGGFATGTSTISSLKFGTIGAGANVATFNSAGNFNITNTLGVGHNGNGTLNVTAGTFTVGGVTTVNTNGKINLTGGTFNANQNVVLNAGKLLAAPNTFNLGANRSLTANTGAEVNVSGFFSLGNSTSFTIQSGSTLTTTSFFDVGFGSAGTLLVTGAGTQLNTSTVTAFASSDWGSNGGTANVTISNQAAANIGAASLNICNSITSAGATVNLNTAGKLTANNMRIGTGSAGTGTLTVNGVDSTVTQSGASTLTIGAAAPSTSVGTLNLQASGVFNTGTGAITINKTGTVNVAGGTFNANNDVTVDGGKLLHTAGTFNLPAGKNLTVSNSGQVSFTGAYHVPDGGTFTIQSGASLSTTDFLGVGFNNGDGTLLVTGLGSSLAVNTGQVTTANFGVNDNTATITVADRATATFAHGFDLTNSSNSESTSTFAVTSDADVTAAGSVYIADGIAGSATLTVNGEGSTFTLTGASQLSVGGADSSTSVGTLNVQSGGNFNTGTGAVTIQKTGTVNIAGGTFNANGDVTLDGGKLLHTSGTFNPAAGKNLTASNAAQVSYTGGFHIQNGGVFTIQSGSTLSTTDEINVARDNGGGTLIVTGPGSSLNTNTVGSTGNDIGGFGFSATVTIADQATASFGGGYFGVARSSNPGSIGTLNVTTGAQLTSNFLQLGSIAGGAGAGVVNVNGAGSQISLNGASGMEVGTGSVACSVNIQSGGTFQTGTGLTTIGANGKIDNAGGTFSAAAVANNGILASAATTTTGAITGTGATDVTGGTLTATGGIRQGTLSISGYGIAKVADSAPTLPAHPAGSDASVSRLDSLTIAAGVTGYYGTLDLTNNDLIIEYSGASPAANVEDMVRSGYNVVGDWQGKGIISSLAAADGTYVLAVADNAALAAPFGSAAGGPLFAGVDVDLTTVLIKFTHRVDINLDGVVTPDDAAIFGTFYDESITTGHTWAAGDLDYDGVCTPTDAAIFGTFYDESLASLPEPASLAALSLLGLGLARRRIRA